MSQPTEEREVEIRCNWCSGTFKYRAMPGEAHHRTGCPWCHKAVHVPADKLRPINGNRLS